MVDELKEQLVGDMAALKAETAQLNTRTLTKLNAAMEQSRSLKAWREQQNLRILEMQVSVLYYSIFRQSTCMINAHSLAA